MTRNSALNLVHLGTALGAVFCCAVFGFAQICDECASVPGCDCNCKLIQCYAAYIKGELQFCRYSTVKTCWRHWVTKVYVEDGDVVTCVEGKASLDTYSATNCQNGRKCAGCGESGAFESETGEGKCTKGSTLITDGLPAYVCQAS